MKFKPSENTKKFIEQVKNLKNAGVVDRFGEIVDALKWDKTALSNVMNGRRDVPPEVYSLFTEVYKDKITPSGLDQGLKDRYIELLERSLKDKEATEQEIIAHLKMIGGSQEAAIARLTAGQDVVMQALGLLLGQPQEYLKSIAHNIATGHGEKRLSKGKMISVGKGSRGS
jgi:DNA-binding Lrp family transcriptional regulator